jgi:hypothetical protein
MQGFLCEASHLRFRYHEFLFVLCLGIAIAGSAGIYTPLMPLAGLAPISLWGHPKSSLQQSRRFALNRTDTTPHRTRRIPRARERSPRPRNLGADDFWIFA